MNDTCFLLFTQRQIYIYKHYPVRFQKHLNEILFKTCLILKQKKFKYTSSDIINEFLINDLHTIIFQKTYLNDIG